MEISHIKSKFKPWIKIIALVVIVSFMGEQALWAGPSAIYFLRPLANSESKKVQAILLPIGIGLDGHQYPESPADQTNREQSERIINIDLPERIRQHLIERGVATVNGADAVNEASWLLKQLCELTNCSDELFKQNMPAHMLEMETITEILAAEIGIEASPELLIAAMFHDSERFFDGYYVMIKDEPLPRESDTYKYYYKPIQHPRMTVKFIMPLLEKLGIADDILRKVDILIRNHETGLRPEIMEALKLLEAPQQFDDEELAALERDSGLLCDADAASVFTPKLLTNVFILESRYDPSKLYAEVYDKYTRSSRPTRRVIERLMEQRKGEYLALEGGAVTFEVFEQVQRKVAVEELYGQDRQSMREHAEDTAELALLIAQKMHAPQNAQMLLLWGGLLYELGSVDGQQDVENSIRVLKELPPEMLNRLGFSRDTLPLLIPIIRYHAAPSAMPIGVSSDIRLLTEILHAADTIDAAGRESRMLMGIFADIIMKFQHGEINERVFVAVADLLTQEDHVRDSALALVCRARQIPELTPKDRLFLRALTHFRQTGQPLPRHARLSPRSFLKRFWRLIIGGTGVVLISIIADRQNDMPPLSPEQVIDIRHSSYDIVTLHQI